MKKGFTLIELVVAVSLLAMVFLFAGTIFRVSIDSYRTSDANAEIMQKLRAVTDQLNSDFAGLQTDAPLLIWFEQDPDPNDPNQRFDQIMFFASGDFQSFQLYDESSGEPNSDGDKLVMGSVARIFYGHAQPAPDLLARRRHILADDEYLNEWHGPGLANFDSQNERYEHDCLSLAQWKVIVGSIYDARIIPTCFDSVGGGSRPWVDMTRPSTFHKLMCEGVGSFAIQWAYWDSGDLKWFPEDSDFTSNPFEFYFNVPGSISLADWDDGLTVADNVYPRALKFTFRLYDSKGIIKEDGRAGRKFTHIVYLDN